MGAQLQEAVRGTSDPESYGSLSNRAIEILFRQSPGALPALGADPAAGQVIRLDVNADPEPGNSRLIRSIEISSPLQLRGLAGRMLDPERTGGDAVGRKAAGKKGRASKGGKHFGGGAAEGAMAGDVSRKCRSNQRALLVGDPVCCVDPADVTCVICRVQPGDRAIRGSRLRR